MNKYPVDPCHVADVEVRVKDRAKNSKNCIHFGNLPIGAFFVADGFYIKATKTVAISVDETVSIRFCPGDEVRPVVSIKIEYEDPE